MFVALGAVISTTINQSQSSVVQNEYNINGAQLNYVSGIQQFVICAIAAFLIETTGRERIQDHHFQTIEIVLILLTGVIATGCNVVGASLIGKAGPVTYQVVGHVKTMLIFTFGLIMFPVKDEPRYRQMKKIGGLLVSMVGVILYTIFEMKNKNKVAEEEEHLLSNPKPEPVLDDIFMEEENNAEFKEDL
ncbi:phosphate translocator protein [Histomonas meleagridis]|uniref:phosphate translocator protein n=1 Tax=Histomonas meleagridis TaxID=135588 RepID=UPI003559DCDF|nr:phosphate translocator protein [Histomonas meleagridis]